jgi:hypothetical protein
MYQVKVVNLMSFEDLIRTLTNLDSKLSIVTFKFDLKKTYYVFINRPRLVAGW